jgi:hypothetical protein
MTTLKVEYKIGLKGTVKHPIQGAIKASRAKRRVIKAGRRGGKTVILAILAVEAFLKGRRVLYATPTADQLDAFWYEVTATLKEPIEAKDLYKNEVEHLIEHPGTKNRIRGKTAWNADTMRGDFADLLLLDEYQLMNEDAWEVVGAPMLLDTNGDAVFSFTPPSLYNIGVSKAKDPRHASKLFKKAELDKTGLWETFHFTSLDNPFISKEGLSIITSDMSLDAYRREILAEDDEIESSWLVYNKFNERICKVDRFEIPREWLVYSGHDFGIANPAALFLAQNPTSGDLFAFKEYLPGTGRSIPQHIDAFQELTKGYSVLRRVGGSPQEDEIRQGYSAHGWNITAPKLSKVNAQIDRIIGLMELNKLFVFKDMHSLLTEMANCMWELDGNKPLNKIKDEQKYHLLACLRYIGSDFTPETVSSDRIPVFRERR